MNKLEKLKEEISEQLETLPVSFHYLTFREPHNPVLKRNTSGTYVKSGFHQTDELLVTPFFKPISRYLDLKRQEDESNTH